MRKLALCVNHIEPDDRGRALVENINKINEKYPKTNAFVFHHDWSWAGIVPLFGMLQLRELWTYDGVAVATNIDTARRVIQAPEPSKKFFYLNDLEWTKLYVPFKQLQSIYMNKELELIANSEEDAKIIEKVWRKPSLIVENYNYEQLIKVLQ
jgi:hypothetical protein